MKYTILLLSLTLTSSALASYGPVSIKGQADANKSTVTNLQVPAKQATLTAPSTYKVETGNGNLLENPSFDHSTVSTGWTTTSTGTATCTLTQETSSPFSGEVNYAKLTASGGASGGTCSLKQSVTTISGHQALISARFYPDPLGNCSGPSAVYNTLVNGSVVTAQTITNCGTTNYWTPVMAVPEISGTTTGLELLITVAASTSTYVAMDQASVELGNVTQTASIITPWQSYTPTWTGFGTLNPTTNQCRWRQIGGSIEVECRATSGTVTAVEPRVSLPNGYTVASNGLPTLFYAGELVRNAQSTTYFGDAVLAEPGASYVVLSTQSATVNEMTKRTASNAVNSSELFSLKFSVPVNELSASTQVFASQCGAACDTEFTFSVDTSTGAVTESNGDPINGSASGTSAGRSVAFNYALANAPRCTATVTSAGTGAPGLKYITVTNTGISTISVFRTDTLATNTGIVDFHCIKQGSDYTNAMILQGSFKDVMTAPGISKPVTCSALIGGASETTACSTGTCSEYRPFGECGISVSYSTTGTTLASVDISKISPLTAQCKAVNATPATGNGVCGSTQPDSSGNLTVYCRNANTNAAANYQYILECKGQAP